MSGEQEYNESITEEVLDHKESLDPKTMRLLTYGRPSDTCQIDGREFPSGRLGNMSGGFHFSLFNLNWYSSEHLYLCGEWSRNTDRCIEIQQYVRMMTSGDRAKRCSKAKYKNDIRNDFAFFRLQWMLWCVWQKCLFNQGRKVNQRLHPNQSFANLLKSVPDDAVIVEVVPNDPMWAVWPDENGILHGCNAMGKILSICRRHLLNGTTPNIDTDLLNDYNIYILGHKIHF